MLQGSTGQLIPPAATGGLDSASNPQPSTSNSQPSTLNPQPSTLNPQPSTLNPQLSTLESIHRRKTGGLISASLRLGAISAGADRGQIDALDRYGCCLGLAFQITDDLLDVGGDETAAGKRLGKDSQRGKLTFPAILGVDASRRRAEELIEDAREAIAALNSYSENTAAGLDAVARYVLERNR